MTTIPRETLALTLPSDREILVTRWFDAPRDLVFRAVTETEHLARWWGPRQYVTEIPEYDFRVGGAYRFLQRTPDGTEHPFKGEFRVIEPPGRLVMTQIYDVPPVNESAVVVAMEFEERDGGTLMTSTMTFERQADRDGMIGSGMEWGMRESYEQLDDLLAALR